MRTEQVSELLKEVADSLIVPRFGTLSCSEVQEKAPGDLVTIADREAEAAISARLREADPAALVVGEEGVFADARILESLPSAGHAWVIDPVDGTRNFAKGRPDFAVMVAELRAGQTVRSWIWQPMFQDLFVAEKSAGVTRNGVALTAPSREREVALGATYLPIAGEETAAVRVIRSWGSCGVDYPKLITGEVDFLSYRSMFPWDHLPGGLMLTELGGRIATESGADYHAGTIGRRLLAATSDAVWDEAQRALFGD
ncbi:MAG: inositol monophosphatase [Propionicimonas sp.]